MSNIPSFICLDRSDRSIVFIVQSLGPSKKNSVNYAEIMKLQSMPRFSRKDLLYVLGLYKMYFMDFKQDHEVHTLIIALKTTITLWLLDFSRTINCPTL